MLARTAVALALSACFVGCVADLDGPDDDGDADGATDTGGVAAEVAGSPRKLNIGFNGEADQFGYRSTFDSASTIHPGSRLCHGYFSWTVGNQAPGAGDATDTSTRAFLDRWLAAAQGHCDEALISFKSMTPRAAPSEAQFAAAFDKLVGANWAAESGFTGAISYTPWNEPNNPGTAGNGLGVVIEPGLAARYYLQMESACRAHGCKVAAGDFASNGNMWDAFEWNCANDNVATVDLCRAYSSFNPSHQAASYLDRYKNEIANVAKSYGLGESFRPEYFAFHGWHDVNEYLDTGNHCATYGDCATRRLLQSLGGSWSHVALWDTEAGAGQTTSPDDHDQACTAAFLLRMSLISNRIERLYVTRLHGGGGEVIGDAGARPALGVLANRETDYASDCR